MGLSIRTPWHNISTDCIRQSWSLSPLPGDWGWNYFKKKSISVNRFTSGEHHKTIIKLATPSGPPNAKRSRVVSKIGHRYAATLGSWTPTSQTEVECTCSVHCSYGFRKPRYVQLWKNDARNALLTLIFFMNLSHFPDISFKPGLEPFRDLLTWRCPNQLLSLQKLLMMELW